MHFVNVFVFAKNCFEIVQTLFRFIKVHIISNYIEVSGKKTCMSNQNPIEEYAGEIYNCIINFLPLITFQ